MPNITIRTSEVFHNTGTYNSNGTACKFIVNQLLALDPDLELAEVVTDNASTYSVRLRVMGSPDVGLYINNSSTTLYFGAGYWNNAGNFVQVSDYGGYINNYFGYYYSYGTSSPSWYPYIRVSVVGIDGVLKYVLFSTSYTTSVGRMYYGMFTSTAYTEPQYCVGSTNTSWSATYPALPPVSFGSTLPTVIREPIADSYELINFSSFPDTTGFLKAGYSYALIPQGYYGVSTNKGFLNIRWGGQYTIYNLFNGGGRVVTQPGESVTVGGVSMLSPGYVSLVE